MTGLALILAVALAAPPAPKPLSPEADAAITEAQSSQAPPERTDFPAFPSDTPLASPVLGGTGVFLSEDGTEQTLSFGPGYYLNLPGYARLATVTNQLQRDLAAMSTENAKLKKSVDSLTNEVRINWKVAVVIGVVGIGIGAFAAIKLR